MGRWFWDTEGEILCRVSVFCICAMCVLVSVFCGCVFCHQWICVFAQFVEVCRSLSQFVAVCRSLSPCIMSVAVASALGDSDATIHSQTGVKVRHFVIIMQRVQVSSRCQRRPLDTTNFCNSHWNICQRGDRCCEGSHQDTCSQISFKNNSWTNLWVWSLIPNCW